MTVVLFTDGSKVDVIDADCEFRPCYVFGYNKGPFTPGVGYTRPETPWRPVCLTRDVSGCPHKDVDEEHAVLLDPLPCCSAPRVPKNLRARSQRCQSCGARLRGKRLEIARAAA